MKDAKDDQLFPDKPRKGPKGELLDRNGNVVASTRREKQLAYNLNRAQYAANQAQRQMRQMQQHIAHYQALDQRDEAEQLVATDGTRGAATACYG